MPAGLFELWETSSGNLVGTYASEREALAVIRKGITTHGQGYADIFLLALELPDGESRLLAEGKALAALADSD